jgi:antitoxin component YwqK of YwqJK toxin-antitoxin module
MLKKNIFILIILFGGCKSNNNKEVIVARYQDGKTRTSIQYYDLTDTSKYFIKVYFNNGDLLQNARVDSGAYIGKKVTYFQNHKVSQVDSLFAPQIIGDKKWTGMVTRFYPNGSISQRYLVKDGKMDGLFQNYKENGIISKEYQVIDTIKNGSYTEYHENGVKSYQTTYLLGKRQGMEYYFNLSGDTIEYGMFWDGKYKFPYKKWLTNGIALVGNYINEQETKVKWEWVDSSGAVLKTKNVYSQKHEFHIPE